MRAIEYHPKAKTELDEAGEWYFTFAGQKVAADFLWRYDLLMGDVAGKPLNYHVRRAEFRAAVMQSFPFVIHFRMKAEVVYVIAVAHGSRSPNYWWDRDAGD